MHGRFDSSIFDHVETAWPSVEPSRRSTARPGSPVSAVWSRVPGHLEPSAATLAIFGDYVSGGVSQPMGRHTMGRSLDNTMRIATLEPTEWVLCEIHMHALRGASRKGTAFLWSRDGNTARHRQPVDRGTSSGTSRPRRGSRSLV